MPLPSSRGVTSTNVLPLFHVPRTLFEIFPFRYRDTGLSKNGSQEILPNVAPVRIRNPYPELLFDNELVFPSRIRSAKTQLAKATNQLRSRYWSKAWHLGNFLDSQRDTVNGGNRMTHFESQNNPLLQDFS